MAREQLADTVGPDVIHLHNSSEKTDQTGLDATGADDDPGAYRLASNAFGHYFIPDELSETPQARELGRGAVPEDATTQLIRRKLGRGDLVTGCTGVGAFLPAFHDALAGPALIHGFEADIRALTATRRTIWLNGMDRVRMHHAIAGKQNRQLRVSKLGLDPAPDAGTVSMCRLDDIVPEGRYVSVIHLNACDREIPALLGAGRILQDSTPMLVLHAPEAKRQRFYLSCLEAHFPDLGYAFAGTVDDNAIYLPLSAL